MSRLLTVAGVACGGALLVLACGGTSAKYKVDDVSLAQIPVAEKQEIFNAQNEISVAKSEAAKSDSDVHATDHDLDIAQKEAEQARLETQKAKLERDAANQSRDQNRIVATVKFLQVAEVGERQAGAKVHWLEQMRRWHKSLIRLAEEHEGYANARVEFEKAKLAQAKNIKPTADFSVATFQTAFGERTKRMGEATRSSELIKIEADKRLNSYNDLKQHYGQLRAASSLPPGPNTVSAPQPLQPAPQPDPTYAPQPTTAPPPEQQSQQQQPPPPG